MVASTAMGKLKTLRELVGKNHSSEKENYTITV